MTTGSSPGAPGTGLRLVVFVGMAVAMLLIAQHIAGKAARDALFLTHYDVSQLPKLMMGSAALSVVAVIVMSRVLRHLGPTRLLPPLYLASAALLVGEWLLAARAPGLSAIALYIHVAVLNSLLISGFWSLINECFDPYTAKSAIPRLVAAATFGGLVGGLAASAVASVSDTRTILLMLGAMHLACGAGARWIASRQAGGGTPRQDAEAPTGGGNLLGPLGRSPLIRRMAILALLVASTAALLDYILKAQASASLSDQELISFFSFFYTGVGLGTFLVQALVGKRALAWFGIGGSMAAWPLVILLGGAGVFFLRSLVTVTLMRAAANLFYNSFFRSGFELLYTPIPPGEKRTGKLLIDVGADRAGDIVGGMIVLAILSLPLPIAPGQMLLTVTLTLAALCLTLILVLQMGYVGQLARNLRAGEPSAMSLHQALARGLGSLPSAQATLDRQEMLGQIAAARRARATVGDAAGGRSVDGPTHPDPVIEAIAALRGSDVHRQRSVLASAAMTPELLSHAVALLGDERTGEDAFRAIGRVVGTFPGQLVDAMLDPAQPPNVKRRLPDVLACADSQLAVAGLAAGLDDRDRHVRSHCARALLAMRKRNDNLRADDTLLDSRIAREVRLLVQHATGSARARSGETGPLEDHHQFKTAFALIGARYGPQDVELCLRALRSDDRMLRGTALEYLENVLPEEVWSLLKPLLMEQTGEDEEDASPPGNGDDGCEADATLAPGTAPATPAAGIAAPAVGAVASASESSKQS